MIVLIVDDIEDNRTTLSLLLEDVEEDINIIEATNGKEAVDICGSTGVDIVLMDVLMPVMDGIEATKLISSMKKKPIIVAVSALSDNDKKNEMLAAGAQDYITKPINDELFIARMKNYKKIVATSYERNVNSEWAINPFAPKVYSRKVVFHVTNESSLAEFWEFYLLCSRAVNDNLSDCVRTIYNTGLILLKTYRLFDIIIEEDDVNLYFTVIKIGGYNKEIVAKIFERNFPKSVKKFGESAFSVKVEKSYKNGNADSFQQIQPAKTSSKPTQAIKTETPQVVLERDNKYIESPMAVFSEKISAHSFLLELEDSYFDKIDTLYKTEDVLDCDIFDFETSGNIEHLHAIARSILQYADVIDSLHEFKNICLALNKLSEYLLNIKASDINDIKLARLTLILKCIYFDLTEWRKNIFIDKVAVDIHYLDNSLISNCTQIDFVFNEQVAMDSEDDLVLF